MNIDKFLKEMNPVINPGFAKKFVSKMFGRPEFTFDPCPDVMGMASSKKLRLLNVAVSQLESISSGHSNACYLEVGTYRGKSLISAIKGNGSVTAVACDNFSEFNSEQTNDKFLMDNLEAHGLKNQVRFFDCNFVDLLADWKKKELPPVGVYFYDGAHDEESQFQGIKMVEPILADTALVIVDDWRFADDSQSYAKVGTLKAIAQSNNKWLQLMELPARFNGDLEQWWNGLGVFQFQRLPR